MLRGINVSGQKKIKMADLRSLYSSLGFTDVESYIQSGNVVFSSDIIDRERVKGLIETAIEKQYGFNVPVILRTREELRRIIEGNPFIQDAAAAHGAPYVTFFDTLAAGTSPDALPAGLAGALEPLKGVVSGEDRFELSGSEIYLFCPGGYGKTKYTNNRFEKASGLPATTRNWKTVKTLFEM